jgi:PAS domain S-box-containing protein
VDGFSRAEFELALDAGRAGTFRADPATGAIRWSRSLAAIIGIEPGEAPLSLEATRAFVHPDDRTRLDEAMRRALQTGAPQAVEIRAVRPDGGIRWFAVRGRLLQGDGSSAPTLVGVVRDVGDERALLGDRALLDAIFAVAPVGLALFDTELRYVRVNPALADMNGVGAEEHLGRLPSEVLPAGGAEVERLLRSVLDTGERPSELRVDAETDAEPGARRSFAVDLFPLASGGGAVTGVGSLVREITDAVRAQAARDQALARARLLTQVGDALDASLDYDRTLRAVADLAVRSIAEWCSIDLPDGAGGVRNVAVAHVDRERVTWARRLGQRYPPDPEAATGVPNVLRTGRPELYPEIPRELLVAGARDAEHLEIILALDMRSAMCVPLRARGRTLGALTLIRTGDAPAYTEEDLTFAGEIAARAALAVDNARLYREAGERRDLYEALLDAQSELGEAVALIEDGRIVFANAATERLLGRPAAELLALGSVFEILPPEHHVEVGERLARVAREGEAGPRFELDVLRADGTRVPVELGARALAGAEGLRLVVIARDITERRLQDAERERLLAVEQAARRASEAAHARVRLVSDVSGALERSFASDAGVQDVAELLVGPLADACAIDVADAQGVLRRVAAHAGDGRRGDELWALAREHAPRAGSDHPLAEVLRSSRAKALQAAPGGDPGARLSRALGEHGLVVPLVARGRALGTLALGWEAGAEPPGLEDRSLVEALAQRVALAVDNAEQYRERAYVARMLQASLLPRSLPTIDGADLAAQYVAGGEGVEVGGDFYDVFDLAPGAWALVIGDVCGKGAEAAAVTALARYTLRALADPDVPPAATLQRLNAELLRQSVDQRFLSAVFGNLVLGDGGRARVALATGGHPGPIVLRRDGGAEALGLAGTLLGVESGIEPGEVVVELGPGDGLVLYTDGITEADRNRPLPPARLAEELAPLHADSAAGVARHVVALAEQRAPDRLLDDLAVLVLRTAADTRA